MPPLVWVDDWQQQCCGEPFSVGSRVTWVLRPATGPSTTGVVTRIRTACCAYASDPASTDPRVFAPVASTSVVTDVQDADAWYEAPEPLQLNGFLVDLQPVAG